MDRDRFQDEAIDGDEIVRSFMATEGRTRARVPELPPETLVSVTELGRSRLPELRFEQREIVGKLEGMTSIAEISAKDGLPLRAAIVIVSELVADRLLDAQEVVDLLGLPMLHKIRQAIAAL